MGMVVVAEVPALDQEAIRRENQKLITTRAPFEGETRTGGERTRFLPHASTNFYKPHPVPHNHPYSWYQRPTIVGWRCQEYKPHPVPQGWSRTKDTHSDSSQPMTICSRSSYEARTGVEQRNRRLCHPSGHQRCQVTTDRQSSSKASLQSGAGRVEERPSHRRGHKGSVYSGLVLVSLIHPP